ncbi:MAG: DUF6597 domain-containing transcriptional factor [Bacteroidales bacterium]
MQNVIKRYPVQHPLLQKYIKFFWEFRVDQIQLNHKLIPQRNINIRINLSDTPHYHSQGSNDRLLDNVYFMGLQNKCTGAYLKVNGNVDIVGICFKPYGLFPFVKIPVYEFKNRILGASEINFNLSAKVCERLKECSDTTRRLAIIETELVALLNDSTQSLDKFQLIFNALIQGNTYQLNNFCTQNNIGIRQLERLFLKYIGLSPNTYTTLNRFHGALNQMLNASNAKLTSLAYDNEYFDQMHFIKEFKRYTGSTPKSFTNTKNSILQIGQLA